VDSAWNQEKLEVRKIPENGAESHLSCTYYTGQKLPYGILSRKARG